ncbi:hypothetical protein HJFPF1_04951 [Paramyrothecium foliicola]|nr:hypothetical protein HJFPF1_04951 [Paramyrothecium foliicola]
MDHTLSPTNISSSDTSAPPTAPRQPTYTTAGTLWNPSASQPLQAPARRGRSFKWATGNPRSDLALFPKHVLASLPLKANFSRAPSFQRYYTPLQQNYDRAVSPFSDQDHKLATMSPQTPSMRSGNTLAPLASPLSQLEKGKSNDASASEGDDEADDGDDDDDDSDFNMNPLRNMTVKSLNNLASYPNPNQRRAQKALYGRTKPTLAAKASVAGASAPTSPSFRRMNSPAHRLQRLGFPALPTAQSDSSLLKQEQSIALHPPDLYRHHDSRGIGKASNNMCHSMASTSTSLAPGPGAPRPLTAGPPGQRQYRASTFESTFKALQNGTRAHAEDINDHETIEIARQTMLQSGIDDTELVENAFPSPLGIYIPESAAGPISSSVNEPPRLVADMFESAARPSNYLVNRTPSLVADTQGSGLSGQTSDTDFMPVNAYEGMFGASHQGDWYSSQICLPEKPKYSFENLGQFKPGTDRLNDMALMARKQKIDRYWYEGVGVLARTTEDVFEVSGQRNSAQKLGAIGDGRPHKPRSHHRTITIEDANRMPVAEHAKPLLNLALASLLQKVENDGLHRDQHTERNLRVVVGPC